MDGHSWQRIIVMIGCCCSYASQESKLLENRQHPPRVENFTPHTKETKLFQHHI